MNSRGKKPLERTGGDHSKGQLRRVALPASLSPGIGRRRRIVQPNRPLSEFAVYTIRLSSDLDAVFKTGGAGQFTEHRKWTTALRLFDQAKQMRRTLPVIFAGGECIDGLLYWAIITALKASDSSTTYSFAGLRRLDSKPPLSSLRLRVTGDPLSDNFIRPYAIVHTPAYVRAAES